MKLQMDSLICIRINIKMCEQKVLNWIASKYIYILK